MVTAALGIGIGLGIVILFIGIIFLVVGAIALAMALEEDSGVATVFSLVFAIIGVCALVFSGIGLGEGISDDDAPPPVVKKVVKGKSLPDFAGQCRGKLEISVFKTERRQEDVENVEEAVEDEIGCKNAVEEILQIPFGSYVKRVSTEPPPVELVPALPDKIGTGSGSSGATGGVTAPNSQFPPQK